MEHGLALAALDALPFSVAVVGPGGIVVAVNTAWREFALANGGRDDGSEGTNYLAVCDRAWADDGEDAAMEAARQIRRLLAGDTRRFALEYPCHAPDEKRWFMASGSALAYDGAPHAVIAHLDVTARRLAEMATEETNEELQRALAREELLARTDPLTGIANRRHFYALAEHELAVAERYGHPLSVILFDLDDFKSINDRFGHQVGDDVLRTLAESVGASLRAADLLARHGGEEFAVVLPHTELDQAAVVAEHIREAIRGAHFASVDGRVEVSVSAGVAQARPAGDGVDALVARADRALYRAKAEGRDRVVADPVGPDPTQ